MKTKSYVKTIEEENYTLRQRVDDLDCQLKELNRNVDEMSMQVNMTMHSSLTNGIDDFFTETASIYTYEADAIYDISISMNNVIEGVCVEPVWKKWRKDKIEKCMDVKLYPKWSIDYWYLGLRFLKVNFVLHKKKKNFVKIFINDYYYRNNFTYTEQEDVERMTPYMTHTPTHYKKKLYSYINDSTYKAKFTPYK